MRCATQLLALLCAVVELCGAQSNAEQGSGDCSQEAPTRCFTEGSGFGFVPIYANAEDLDRACRLIRDSFHCIDEYTMRCMTPLQRTHFQHLYSSTATTLNNICHDGPYKEEFLRHAPCIQKVQLGYERCAQNYQKQILLLGNATEAVGRESQEIRSVCCHFQDFLRCSKRVVMAACGEQTARFTTNFLDSISSPLIQSHCDKLQDCSISTRQLAFGFLVAMAAAATLNMS